MFVVKYASFAIRSKDTWEKLSTEGKEIELDLISNGDAFNFNTL